MLKRPRGEGLGAYPRKDTWSCQTGPVWTEGRLDFWGHSVSMIGRSKSGLFLCLRTLPDVTMFNSRKYIYCPIDFPKARKLSFLKETHSIFTVELVSNPRSLSR